jgi:hypothetical protein
MLMRADENYTSEHSCSPEELLACVYEDDVEVCLAACSE